MMAIIDAVGAHHHYRCEKGLWEECQPDKEDEKEGPTHESASDPLSGDQGATAGRNLTRDAPRKPL
jgi:hypothetical protein